MATNPEDLFKPMVGIPQSGPVKAVTTAAEPPRAMQQPTADPTKDLFAATAPAANPVQTALDSNPVTRQVQDKETVQGQLKSLFDEGNPILVQARETAKRMAAGRGLQNTSIATQAGEQALISSALPIAQFDATAQGNAAAANQQAQNTFNLSERQTNQQSRLQGEQFGYSSQLSSQEARQRLEEQAAGGDIQAKLELAKFGYERNLTTLRGDIAKEQSNLDFANRLTELAKQGDIQSRLQLEQFGFNTELSAQENLARLQQIASQGDVNASLQLQQFQFQSLLNDQQAGIQLELEDARFQNTQSTILMEYAQRGVLSDQEARQEMERLNQNHANTLEQIQAQVEAQTQGDASAAGRALQNNYLLAISDRQRQASQEIAQIYQTEGLNASQQNAAVQNAYNRMRSDIETLQAYYASSPLWDPNFQRPATNQNLTQPVPGARIMTTGNTAADSIGNYLTGATPYGLYDNNAGGGTVDRFGRPVR